MESEDAAQRSADVLVPRTPSLEQMVEADLDSGVEEDECEPQTQLGCAASEPSPSPHTPRVECHEALRRAIAELCLHIFREKCSPFCDSGVDKHIINALLEF